MGEQLQLTLTAQATARRRSAGERRFEAYHRAHPEVLDHILQVARELNRRGFTRVGMGLIFERLRWLHAVASGGDSFKLNNNYRAYYARVVMALEPALQGFFRLRDQEVEYEPDLVALGLRTEAA